MTELNFSLAYWSRNDSQSPVKKTVPLNSVRADGENDSKRKIAQGSISATASAAAYRSQNENVSARFGPDARVRLRRTR